MLTWHRLCVGVNWVVSCLVYSSFPVYIRERDQSRAAVCPLRRKMLHAQDEANGGHSPEFTNTQIKSVIEELRSTSTKADRLSTEVTLNMLKMEKVPEIRVPKAIVASWASLSYEEHCKAANKYKNERTQYLKLEERVARMIEGNINHTKSKRPTNEVSSRALTWLTSFFTLSTMKSEVLDVPFPSASGRERSSSRASTGTGGRSRSGSRVGGGSKSAPAGRDSARRSTRNVWQGRASTRNIWAEAEFGDKIPTHDEDGEKLWRNSMAPNDGFESNKMPEYRADGRRRSSHRISNQRVSFYHFNFSGVDGNLVITTP